jgi:hypothetical protein
MTSRHPRDTEADTTVVAAPDMLAALKLALPYVQQIAIEQAKVGASAQVVWFAYVGGNMLRDRRGVGRRFRSESAARNAALNAAAAESVVKAVRP